MRAHFQVNLFAILAFTTLIATWTSIRLTERETRQVQARLDHLRPFKQRLIIYDERRITAVRQIPEWIFACVWDIYIPSGTTKSLVVEGERVSLLQPGTHTVEWSTPWGRMTGKRHGGFRSASLSLNKEVVYHSTSDSGVVSWRAMGKGDGGLYELTDCDADDKLELAKDPTNGRSLIWIE